MLIFLMFVLFVAFLMVFALARHIRKARARARADRIIAGEVEANAVQINNLIRILASTSAWLVNRAFRDQYRIERLREHHAS